MSKNADWGFVSIGVLTPVSGLDVLPEAIKVTEATAWATAQGYATDPDPWPEVTVDPLREEIAAAIKRIAHQTARQRCGFALRRSAGPGDQYGILAHCNKRPTEAIKVSSLLRSLEYYGSRSPSLATPARKSRPNANRSCFPGLQKVPGLATDRTEVVRNLDRRGST